MDEAARIREMLREHPLGMNIKEIAEAVGLSRNSAAKYLDVLTATGQLDVRQIGNAKLYYHSPRVPVKNLLGLTREMIVMLDRHLRIVQSSDSFNDFVGSHRAQVLGSRLSRLNVPVLSENEETGLASLINGGPARAGEVQLVKNGDPVYLSARFVPVVFDGGDPGITVMFDNITAQRNAELALAGNERFLYTALQVFPAAAFLIDRNHTVIVWNRALEIMTNLKAEDMEGTSLPWKAFYTGSRPCLADILLDGDAARLEQLYGNECRASPNRATGCETTEFFPALGPRGRWLHCTATVIRDIHGNPAGAIETIEDVTDMQQRKSGVNPVS
jgi:PAS domain S-box-containing protein